MFYVIQNQTANELWHSVTAAVTHEETSDLVREQASRGGYTREIMHAALSLEQPRQRWISSRQPPLNPAFAIAEVIWILTGRNDADFLNYFNRQLAQYCGPGNSYDGAYGHRLRVHLGVDQLHHAYETLKVNPESRQVVLQIWDANIDLPERNGKPRSPDIPCNIVSMLKVRGGRLEWTQIMRSNDIFRGLPYNLVQWTTLQEIVAGWLGLELGSYNHVSDSLHVYEDSLPFIVSGTMGTEVINTDELALPYEESQRVFNDLASIVDILIKEKQPTSTLPDVIASADMPQAYKNWLCILCAESARRRHELIAMSNIMANCLNPALTELFSNWTQRVGTPK